MPLLLARNINIGRKYPRLENGYNIGRRIVKLLFIAGFALFALINLKYFLTNPTNNNKFFFNDLLRDWAPTIESKDFARNQRPRSPSSSSSSSSSFLSNSSKDKISKNIYNYKNIYSISDIDKLRSASPYFKSRNLVLTFAEDVDDGYLSIFLNTLRESSLNSEVIVFIKQWNVNRKIVQMAQSLKVRFVLFNREKPAKN